MFYITIGKQHVMFWWKCIWFAHKKLHDVEVWQLTLFDLIMFSLALDREER